MQTGFNDLTKAIKNSVPSSPTWAKDVAVIATYAAIVIVCVAAMVLTRGSAASSITAMVASQVASTVISSSTMLQLAVTDMAKAVDPKASDESIAIALALVTAVCMLALAIGAGKIAGSNAAESY